MRGGAEETTPNLALKLRFPSLLSVPRNEEESEASGKIVRVFRKPVAEN